MKAGSGKQVNYTQDSSQHSACACVYLESRKTLCKCGNVYVSVTPDGIVFLEKYIGQGAD